MSFNIDKIIKECPRAWEGCKKYFIHPHNYKDNLKTVWDDKDKYIYVFEDMQGYNTAEIHFRELYDFFDSVGVEIYPFDNELSDYGFKIKRVYLLHDVKVRSTAALEIGYDTRTEAEYRAFEKAFEIYEKQLGGN